MSRDKICLNTHSLYCEQSDKIYMLCVLSACWKCSVLSVHGRFVLEFNQYSCENDKTIDLIDGLVALGRVSVEQ